MSRIKGVKRQTDNRFLNLFELQAERRNGDVKPYFVASRVRQAEELKAVSHNDRCDGVIIYGVHGEKKDKVVLVRQYRYPIGDYIYEFPAGLVEAGEEMVSAGVREFFEETGLKLTPIETAG
ncbi:MAG: NUDIX hydrolase, partial [Anaerotignum sp.]|nr:NUDIX hydrolase [Anaerotignum sp.]